MVIQGAHTIEPSPRLFTPAYVLTIGVQLFVSLVFISLMTFMAVYAIRMFAVEETAAGFAAGAYVLGAALARLAFGKYIDVIGRRRVLIVGLIVFGACSGLYLLAINYPLLITVRLIHGLAFGLINTAITAVAISLIPAHRLAEGIGYFGISGTIANGIGPLLAVPMSLSVDPVWMFTYTGALSVLSLVAVLILKIPEPQISATERETLRGVGFDTIVDLDALPVAGVVLLCGLGYSVVMTYLTPFMISTGEPASASIFFAVFSVAMLLVRLFAGRLQDRRGENSVIPALLLCFAAGLGLLALTQDLWAVVLAGTLVGCGFGGAVPCLQVVGVQRATPERVSMATSTHFLALDSGVALAPVLLGSLITYSGYRLLYATGVGLMLASLGIYWFVHGRYHRGRIPRGGM
ncbi:MFS transporter [Auritidibacter ignavus]|uniref:MFS transporter n=1 Tax=Auritidibacter ignavus TaxID=678932 RepID=UPI0024469256|nr:MFS transporter [Auritidibacter ignavus]WGH87031.1 MFS transporter [Auritidibacter ignavus]WGH89314.1 MFS transporter [Auritidibacter ignavus]